MSEQIVVGPCQVSFPHLDKTEEFQGVDTGKYTCTFLFDKDSDSVKAMKKKIAEVGGGKGSNPLTQIAADAEWDAGKYRIKGKSKFRVKIIDAAGDTVAPDQVMGSTVQAVLGFAAYTQGTGGVTTYLNAIRILRAGTGGDVDFGPVPAGYEDVVSDPLPF
jgi:hypothetical protein